jgi:hypothetical protein
MRRTVILIALVLAGLSPLFAQSGPSGDDELHHTGTPGGFISQTQPVPAAREFQEILDGARAMALATVTVNDLTHLLELASVANQQQEHVERSARLSFMVPGLGQFMNGQTGTALGFMAGNLAINATALVVGYLLLPASVQHINLNYLQTPMADIDARWQALTVSELLPSVAVAVSGSILSAIIRHFASRDARSVARQAIEAGAVTFRPAPLMTWTGKVSPVCCETAP